MRFASVVCGAVCCKVLFDVARPEACVQELCGTHGRIASAEQQARVAAAAFGRPRIQHRDMWDRLTASTPTVTLESTFRQPIRRFTVSRPPPVPLVVSPVFPRCTGVCVFVPCGIFRGTCSSALRHLHSAPRLRPLRSIRLWPPLHHSLAPPILACNLPSL